MLTFRFYSFCLAFLFGLMALPELIAQEVTVLDQYETMRKKILEHPAIERGSISWSFRDVLTGQELDAYQSKKLMVPASTVKIFTTALALQKLGISYQFETKIGVTGQKKKKSLHGDLIIEGKGDPSFGSGLAGSLPGDSVLAQIYSMLCDSGISRIKGNIVINPNHFPYNELAIPRNYVWEDIGNYYGAGAWGLNWRNNEFTVLFTPPKNREDSCKAKIVSPWAQNLDLKTSLKSVYDYSREIYIYSSPLASSVLAEGEVKINSEPFTERGALPNPPLSFGKELKQYLVQRGIQVDGEVSISSGNDATAATWKVFLSPFLYELVNETNRTSNNVFAECLAKTLAINQIGRANYPTGEFLMKSLNEYKPYSDSALCLVDGNGLSRKNLVSTSFQSQFLRTQTKDSRSTPYFIGSLPKAGEEGTLKNFPKIENLRAKSGSMDKVRSYSGYFYDQNNHWIAFSIITNNVPLSMAQQKVMMADLLSAAASHKFELPFPFAHYGSYQDTLNLLPEIVQLKTELKNNPQSFFKNEELHNDRIEYVFSGEPSVEQPYFFVTAKGGGSVYSKSYSYRFHAQTRFAERWNPGKNEWEMICWGDIFMKKK